MEYSSHVIHCIYIYIKIMYRVLGIKKYVPNTLPVRFPSFGSEDFYSFTSGNFRSIIYYFTVVIICALSHSVKKGGESIIRKVEQLIDEMRKGKKVSGDERKTITAERIPEKQNFHSYSDFHPSPVQTPAVNSTLSTMTGIYEFVFAMNPPLDPSSTTKTF